MQTNRIVAVFTALVLGFFALQLGDGIHHLTVLDMARPKPNQSGWIVWASVIGVAAAVAFGVFFSAMLELCDNNFISIGMTIIVTTALGFYFGIIVGPVSEWGPYPWYWFQSKWAILLVLALLPPICLLVEFCKEASLQRRTNSGSNVTPIRASSDK